MDTDHHEVYINRLGNLTMLGHEFNRSAINKIFESKKEIYRKSDIAKIQELNEYSSWSIKAIEERQEKLAE